MNDGLKAILYVVGVASALVGGGVFGMFVAKDSTETHVSQACARDGYFELVRGGITWTYDCSKPRIAP